MRIFIMLLPWLELFTLIQLGIKTSALTALAYVLFTVLLGMAVFKIAMFKARRDGLIDKKEEY